MSGYAFHPDAFADLDEIWEYQDNIDAGRLCVLTLLEDLMIAPRRRVSAHLAAWQSSSG